MGKVDQPEAGTNEVVRSEGSGESETPEGEATSGDALPGEMTDEATSSVSASAETEGAYRPGLAENSPQESSPGAAASPEGKPLEDETTTETTEGNTAEPAAEAQEPSPLGKVDQPEAGTDEVARSEGSGEGETPEGEATSGDVLPGEVTDEATSSVSADAETEGAYRPGLAENSPQESSPGAAASPEGKPLQDETTTEPTEGTPAVPAAETPVVEPAAEPAAETPAEEPATEPAAEMPVVEPATEPAAEAPEPARGNPAEPAAEEPAAEPAAEMPVVEPATEPAAEMPVETPAESPAETPAESPVEIPAEEAPAEETPAQTLVIRVTGPEGLSAAGGACRVDMTQVSAVTLEWTCSAEHDGFAVTVTGPDGGQTYNAVQAEASLTLSVKGMQPGTYAVSVAAMLGETAVAEAKLNIELAQGEGMPEGGIPGGKPGGGSKGGGSRSGGSEQTAEAAMQGFSVTAGKALTSSHDPGDKSMRLYGSVELSAEEEAMTRLTLGGEALDVTLDGGAGTFTAALDGDALTLTPQADGEQWTLNGFALKTLARSGVNTVNLSLNGKIVAVATQPELSGRVYDGLCAAGFVSADYAYNVSAGGIRVSVNGEDYCLTEAGELAEDETISTEVK